MQTDVVQQSITVEMNGLHNVFFIPGEWLKILQLLDLGTQFFGIANLHRHGRVSDE